MSYRTTTSTRNRLLGLLCALLAVPAFAGNDIVPFTKGALIIPMQANFQTGCGTISGYGLVWRILQNNQPGGFNANNPVTVYWAINAGKTSPNRCVPTNLQKPPNPTTGSWNDAQWNDGCDTAINNTGDQPVVPVDYTAAFPASGVYPDANVPMFTPGSNSSLPIYTATSNMSHTGQPKWTDIQYMGAPFIISATDAPNVIKLIQNAKSTGDTSITQYTTPCTCKADVGDFSCNYVQMHQATQNFSAYIGRRLNLPPPKIAVVDKGNGVVSVLDTYLNNAGLIFSGASGCPLGTKSTCVKDAKAAGQNWTPGTIFDRFYAIDDFVSTDTDPYGLINRVDPVTNKLVYQVLWMPHWIGDKSANLPYYHGNGDGASTQLANAMNNIAHFSDQLHTGVLSECASVDTLEGMQSYSQPSPATSWLFSKSAVINGLKTATAADGTVSNDAAWDGKNCTDPNYNGSDPCTVYPNAGDPYSQIGDFRFRSVGGVMESFRPDSANGSVYKNKVKQLATSWQSYKAGTDPRTGNVSSNNGWDIFDLGFKDGDINKATILYLAGHSYTGSVAGQRIVLNTLLNLGSTPTGPERALAAPVAYEDLNGSDAVGNKALAFTSTYEAITNYPPGVDTFVPSQASIWVFPYVPGHLRAHTVIGTGALATGAGNNLADATLWDAASNMPLPGARNLFTYFGGQAKVNPVMAGGGNAPRGVLQVGWVPEGIAGTAINGNYGSAPNPNCTDVLSLGKVTTAADAGTFGFIPGPDGICDLQEGLEFTSLVIGSDYGASEQSTNQALFKNDLPTVQQLLQRVLGYCIATTTREDGSGTPILTPTLAQCNDPNADNRAHLGGLVHSSPVIVPPSPNITDLPVGKTPAVTRPTMAYVGGYDGQLHAIYVSGGKGYQGPAGGLSYATPFNPSADSQFATNYAANFAGGVLPAAGTELWSFMPASQLPLLKSNSAKVDASPIAQDIFTDLLGNGIRQWHTIVVASTGDGGGEVFALDVTNPLKPVLLWDIQGNLLQTGGVPAYAVNILANTDVGGFQERGKRVEPFEPTGVTAFTQPTGLYNYSDMGASSGVAIGQFRNGIEPVYAVFVSTNAMNSATATKGIEVFSIEAGTGQKLWQWEQPYLATNNAADNTTPPSLTAHSTVDGVSQIYVGDMEGRLWELDALSGQNLDNYAVGSTCSGTVPCKLAALDANIPSMTNSPQPLTTNIAIGKIPPNPAPTSALASYAQDRVLIVGTGGADWVNQSTNPGRLHLVILDTLKKDITTASGLLSAKQSGVLTEPAPFPDTKFGPQEHLYGTITVSGSFVFFETAIGQIGDIMKLDGSVQGSTRYFDLGAISGASNAFDTAITGINSANFGGVAIYQSSTTPGQVNVIGAQTATLSNTVITNANVDKDLSLSVDGGNNGSLYRMLTWVHGFFSR